MSQRYACASFPPAFVYSSLPGRQAFVEAQNALTQSVLAQCDSRVPFRQLFTKLYNYERYGEKPGATGCCWGCYRGMRPDSCHFPLALPAVHCPTLPPLPFAALAAGTPYRRGQRYYFSHNSGLQNQSVVRFAVLRCAAAARASALLLRGQAGLTESQLLNPAHRPAEAPFLLLLLSLPGCSLQLYSQGSLEGERRVLIDPNTLSEDGTVALGGQAFSEDGTLYGEGRRAGRRGGCGVSMCACVAADECAPGSAQPAAASQDTLAASLHCQPAAPPAPAPGCPQPTC